MNLLKTLASAALLLAIATAAPAERGHRHNHDPLARLQSKLGLSEAQLAQLRPAFQPMKQRHEAFKQHFRALLTPEQLVSLEQNKGGMRHLQLSDEQKAQMKSYWQSQRESMKQERQQIDAQIQATLTPEQLTKYQQMKSHRGKRHHK